MTIGYVLAVMVGFSFSMLMYGLLAYICDRLNDEQ